MNDLSHQIEWKRCADELPDDDNTVLLALIDGEVCTGFRDAGIWRVVTAAKLEVEVLRWAQFPQSPSLTVEEEPSRRTAGTDSLDRLVVCAALRLQRIYDLQYGNTDINNPDPGDKVNEALLALVKRCRKLRKHL